MEARTSTSAEAALELCAVIVKQNGETVSRVGARMVALCKFVDAVLPELDAGQCARIDALFRQGVEDALATVDDLVVSGAYRATLVEQTNVLLTALANRRVARPGGGRRATAV